MKKYLIPLAFGVVTIGAILFALVFRPGASTPAGAQDTADHLPAGAVPTLGLVWNDDTARTAVPTAEVAPAPIPLSFCGPDAILAHSVTAAEAASMSIDVPDGLAGRLMVMCVRNGDAMPDVGRGEYSGARSLIIVDLATNTPVVTIVGDPDVFEPVIAYFATK
jgi:hypothetical protein